MYYVKKVNGQIVGVPQPLTDRRTASPNTKWKPEQLALYGFELIPDPVKEVTVDDLIAEKIKEIAITALKAEGKLDANGKIKKEN